ncbi:MAG TPA: hypothetical protein VMC79_02055 [Rectinemataceae bacterium]|nr:hypothetical protein [Rectinemataceae bacterium]
MRQKHPKSQDILFVSALAAVLLGIGLLLYTTAAVPVGDRLWPVLVMAAGGALIYFALVQGASDYIFFGGILFVLTGALSILSNLIGWTLREAWPLIMVASGATGLLTGLRRWRRMRPGFTTTSISFLFLGMVFSLFSFKFVTISLKRFVLSWWPSLLIAGGLALFAAYGYTRRTGSGRRPRRGAEREGEDRPRPDHRGPTQGA